MDKKYQIFISSTYTDLVEERKYVQDTIMKMEHFPVGMEIFSASSTKQWNIIKKTIDLSDYYVLIIGYRYGTEMDDGTSYTEREFLYAKEKGIPIIAFIREEGLSVREEYIELKPEKKEKLKCFIEKVKEDREVEWWKEKEDLSNKVLLSLHKEFIANERYGWIKNSRLLMDELNNLGRMDELVNENKRLIDENRKLLEDINNLKGKEKLRKTKSKDKGNLFTSSDFLKMTNHGEDPCQVKGNLHYIDYTSINRND